MAEINDISGLISQLLSDGSDKKDNDGDESGKENGGGIGLDPEILLMLMEIMSKLNSSDKNTELLMALKPHLRSENQSKVDKAAMLMRIMSIIPLLRESGLMENLFG